jgi:SAM-dependent methyltransferase
VINRPYAESAEQNKFVIFDAIKSYLQGEVLEVASGTGQHAVYFASQVPELSWQTSELAANLPGIEAWIEDAGLGNLLAPIELDVLGTWPEHRYDLVYSANCFHIMGKDAVARCLEGVGDCLKPGGVFAVYGPFNYDCAYTSESNARFDQMLQARDPASGIKDFEWVEELANSAHLQLLEDIAMPANNRTLIWQKRTL